MLGFSLQLSLRQICSVCHQEIEPENVRSTSVVVQLVGAAAYAQCVCGQEVYNHHDRNYRRRLRRALARSR